MTDLPLLREMLLQACRLAGCTEACRTRVTYRTLQHGYQLDHNDQHIFIPAEAVAEDVLAPALRKWVKDAHDARTRV